MLRTHDTSALSLEMYLIQVAGIFMWLVYGVMVMDFNLIIANGVTFILSMIILVCKIKNDVIGKRTVALAS